ncbi:hypothetical protein FQZ97_466250 [compost metagenome]
MHPAARVDGVGGGLGVVPVAQHHAVATGAEFADGAARDDPALGVDDLAFQVRLGAADGGHAQFQLVVRAGLQGHRAGLGHAVGDLHFAHVHLVDHPAHHFDRAGGAGHDAGAQAGQVELVTLRVIQLGDEHGGHAVEGGGLLFGHGTQGGQRVEGIARVDHGGAVGQAAEVAHHHAEAVIQRHRDHQAILLGQTQALADHVAVVEDVVVAEGGALGETGGAGGVLDVDGVVELQAGLAFGQGLDTHLPGFLLQGSPGQEARRRIGRQADHAAQLRQLLRGQRARLGSGQLRHQAQQHGVVVGGLEGVGADHPAAAGLLERVFQFAAAIGRVDVDQDGADLGAGELGDAPLGAVGRPDTEAVAALQAQGEQCTGVAVHRFGQFLPAVAQALMPDYQRLALGESGNRGIECRAYGHGEQVFVLPPPGVALVIHGCPFLSLYWDRL